jgi:hypothetical protein
MRRLSGFLSVHRVNGLVMLAPPRDGTRVVQKQRMVSGPDQTRCSRIDQDRTPGMAAWAFFNACFFSVYPICCKVSELVDSRYETFVVFQWEIEE